MRALWLLMFTACLGGAGGLPPEPSPTDKNAKPTIAMQEYASRFQWQRSAYYRTEDTMIDLPVFLAIAGDGTACIIGGQEWALWREHKVVACPGKWRFPR